MDLDFIIHKFESLSELPGIKAHQEVSPMNRPLSYDEIDTTKYRESSVMFFLYKKKGIPHTVVIERNTYDGAHSGQIGLPGGKIEEEDETIFQTAMRESQEEIGIQPEQVTEITQLSTVFIPVSRFIVNPFVSVLKESDPIFIPDPREVNNVIEIPIKEIVEESNLQKTNIRTGSGLILKDVPYFDIQNQVVWGATALIFNEVRHILNS
ncbi:MAG: CoA pyrophosphatase [Crocinitomicaceae bacterium]|nr:CoA pyrophosphatase [Crocinitomicaceae bacterium]